MTAHLHPSSTYNSLKKFMHVLEFFTLIAQELNFNEQSTFLPPFPQ